MRYLRHAMPAFLVLLSIQAKAEEPWVAAYRGLEKCGVESAAKYAKLPDTVKIIVEFIMAACHYELEVFNREMRGRSALRESLIDEFVPKVIVAIADARMKGG